MCSHLPACLRFCHAYNHLPGGALANMKVVKSQEACE